MILFIDNYDSFVYNLARYFQRLQQEVMVVRNDQISVSEIERLEPDAIVISPGPCGPQQAGNSLGIVRELHATTPILGVCLGHQVIAEAFGGKIVRANRPMHGRTSEISHTKDGIFSGIASPFSACRYHSLIVESTSLPECLNVVGTTDDGIIMAFMHKELPIVGLQFHPEAILSEHGFQIAANFLRLSSIAFPEPIPLMTSELYRPEIPSQPATPATIWNPPSSREL